MKKKYYVEDFENKRDSKRGYFILKKLNELRIKYPFFNENECRNELKEIFKLKEFETEEVVNDLLYRIKYQQLKHLTRPLFEDILQLKSELINHLRNAQIKITDVGMAYVDTAETTKTLANNVNIELQKIDKLKEALFFQIIALMGIFIAIITFIFQGISLITKPEFFNLCFLQQLLTATALYLPLIFTVVLIILLSSLIYWIIFRIKRRR